MRVKARGATLAKAAPAAVAEANLVEAAAQAAGVVVVEQEAAQATEAAVGVDKVAGAPAVAAEIVNLPRFLMLPSRTL